MSAEFYRHFPPFRLDPRNERLLRGNDVIALRPKPFALLRYMVAHPGRLVATGENAEPPRFIETIARRGYRFIAEVKRSDDADDDLAPPDQSALAAPGKIPPPVGRDGELARLRSAFLKASTGQRQVMLLS